MPRKKQLTDILHKEKPKYDPQLHGKLSIIQERLWHICDSIETAILEKQLPSTFLKTSGVLFKQLVSVEKDIAITKEKQFNVEQCQLFTVAVLDALNTEISDKTILQRILDQIERATGTKQTDRPLPSDCKTQIQTRSPRNSKVQVQIRE